MTESGTNGDSGRAGGENNGQQGTGPVQGGQQNPQSEGKTGVTFTQDDLDRIISERLDKAKRSWEKEAAEKQKAKDELDAANKLQGEEKQRKLHQLELDKLRKGYDELQAKFNIARAESALSKRGLNSEFAPHLIGASDEETSKNIEAFAKMVDDQVAKKVKESTAKGAPPAPNNSGGDPMRDAIMRGFGVK